MFSVCQVTWHRLAQVARALLTAEQAKRSDGHECCPLRQRSALEGTAELCDARGGNSHRCPEEGESRIVSAPRPSGAGGYRMTRRICSVINGPSLRANLVASPIPPSPLALTPALSAWVT
jgi:hypothetical protein